MNPKMEISLTGHFRPVLNIAFFIIMNKLTISFFSAIPQHSIKLKRCLRAHLLNNEKEIVIQNLFQRWRIIIHWVGGLKLIENGQHIHPLSHLHCASLCCYTTLSCLRIFRIYAYIFDNTYFYLTRFTLWDSSSFSYIFTR